MTKFCSEAFYFMLCQTPILNTDMQIVVFDDLQFSFIHFGRFSFDRRCNTGALCVQINIKGEGSFLFCVLCVVATG